MKVADFGDLTKAEAGLIAHLQGGGAWDFEASEGVPPKDAPADLHIRASLVRALILKKVEDCALPERGLHIWGAYILGDGDSRGETRGLDLEGASIDCDLALQSCRFPDAILLRNARITNLFLIGSVFDNPLSADGLTVKRDIFLRKVEAAGEIQLLGATIGGDLSCSGAKLNATGDALTADRLTATGGVFLREVEAAGEIRLLGATIGGNLDCIGAKLNATGDALLADRLTVTGTVFLDEVEAEGKIRLPGATIGGNLDCVGAKLNAADDALNAVGATIAGTIFWRDGAFSKGAIDLTAATIGTITDDPACWPAEILLVRCRYGAFTGKGVSGRERIDWLSRMKPKKYGYDFWPQPYEECARALREAGHGSDAREVLIEKERLQRKVRITRLRKDYLFEDAIWHRFCDSVLRHAVRYGREPLRAFLFLAGLLVLGTALFNQAALNGEIKPNLPQLQRAPEWVACAKDPDFSGIPEATREQYEPRARKSESQLDCFLRQPEAVSYPRFNPLIYSADTMLPVVAMEMQSYWIPDDSKPIGRWARLYLWLHIAAGWGLTLLAVAGFSGLIKTDNTK